MSTFWGFKLIWTPTKLKSVKPNSKLKLIYAPFPWLSDDCSNTAFSSWHCLLDHFENLYEDNDWSVFPLIETTHTRWFQNRHERSVQIKMSSTFATFIHLPPSFFRSFGNCHSSLILNRGACFCHVSEAGNTRKENSPFFYILKSEKKEKPCVGWN